MQCKQCGAILDDRAKFCTVCGEKLRMAAPNPALPGDTPEANAPAPRKTKRIASIVAAGFALVALALVGNHLLGTSLLPESLPAAAQASESSPAPDAGSIDPAFRDEGAALLKAYTDTALKGEALAVGTKAWEERAKSARSQLDAFAQNAHNELESAYALAVSKLSIYAFANHYESVLVAEQGGRSDEAANAALTQRYENVPKLLESLGSAQTLDELQAICDACDGERAF